MDYSEFQNVAQTEFSAAALDLRKFSPQEATVRFYRRMDFAIEQAATKVATKRACQSGCSYCCYYKVVAHAAEVVVIYQYVVSKFNPVQIASAVKQAKHNVEQVKNLTPAEHLKVNQRCPFLEQDKCTVYAVRPSKCRSFHASNVENCRSSYENPTDLSISNKYIPEIIAVTAGLEQGYGIAEARAGLDDRIYDLNSAFLEAMENGGVSKRLKGKKKVFLAAKNESPVELSADSYNQAVHTDAAR